MWVVRGWGGRLLLHLPLGLEQQVVGVDRWELGELRRGEAVQQRRLWRVVGGEGGRQGEPRPGKKYFRLLISTDW